MKEFAKFKELKERHERIEKIMWDVAKHVWKMGGDVIP
jgi:hypothetical protein